MNRKGFTLVEVLAVIVILAVILTIASPSLINVYKNSKLKTEKIFLDRLSDSIDSYIKLNASDIEFSYVGTATKEEEGSTYSVDIYYGTITEDDIERNIIVNDIINDKLILQEDYVNAGNKEVSCKNATIEVYRDSDYVYCYKVESNSLDCLTEDYVKSICPEESGTCYAIDTCIWEEVK